ncbi:Rpn family recombination-promoting nuclease/putative transposase [Crocosphaera sp. XPORK-15E]|uniref:Rpn family recombination-promoting nuclease/putative transposase n=1 Tax=Crocosphaera sp. XPORK-15E TaxID=3110247 RepID=UPI002B20F952|nr:Rpn family recombination-promoting nuclease/putative transposase [Crocosphaera sp. XPORK-15E]MEA5536778.1 Rpn family recombination-promoting nuclease/putative transposase [Crocosphaera sp. XPORK-15E]
MAKPADIGSKRLISLSPTPWVQWVMETSEVQAREIITTEFQWVNRDTDVLIRAYTPTDGEFLVLNELQLRYTAKMPQRMTAYAALAREKFNLPVYPVLINILEPSGNREIATSYQSHFRGLQVQQDYHVINLWEVPVEQVFNQSLNSLLPFTPILKGGNQETIIRQALQMLRSDEQLNELEPLMAFFASFVLEIPLVQQIMRWDMAVLEQSPWYQEILNRGRKQELIKGIALGLELKFGSQGLELMSEIRSLENVELLDQILETIRTANNLIELRQIYQQ